MWNTIRLLTAATGLLVAKSAMAVVVSGTFSAVAYDGFDQAGLFGPAGGDLTNSVITGTYSYDTDKLSQVVAGTVNSASGDPGAFTLTINIGGYSFTDTLSSSVTLDASSGEVDFVLSNPPTDRYDAFQFGFIATTNELSGTGLAQSFSVGSFDTSYGSLVIIDPVNLVTADFTLTAIAHTVSSTAVPEPGSMVLLASAVLAATAGGWRAGRARPTTGVAD